MTPAQSWPSLFDPRYFEPLNLKSQLDRLPPIDAPCACQRDECLFPFCRHKPDDERNQ